MEPVGAHGFPPVTTDLDLAVLTGFQTGVAVVHPEGFAWLTGEGGAWIAGGGVDGVVAGQLDRPAVVVELAGEKERVGVAVALRRTVAVVLVSRQGMQAEAAVGRRVDRQRVVMTEE
ncbi:hypothetical protein D9M68_524210 [compost metagenome]